MSLFTGRLKTFLLIILCNLAKFKNEKDFPCAKVRFPNKIKIKFTILLKGFLKQKMVFFWGGGGGGGVQS